MPHLDERAGIALTPAFLFLSSCAATLFAPPEHPGAELAADRATERIEAALPSDPGSPYASEPPRDVAGLPGEYEPVERVLFGWHAGNWEYLPFFANVMRLITPDAKIVVAVETAHEREELREALFDEGIDLMRVEFVIHDLDSMWIRDYGPILVRTVEGGFRVIDTPYHADREHDDRYPTAFAQREGLPVTHPAIELEGGHLQSDGTGRCIVTDDLIRRNASFTYSEADVVRILEQFFGCRQVTMLPSLHREETGHVDVYAYVTGPGRVLVGKYDPAEDRFNAHRLDRAARQLRSAGFEVTRIPMPSNANRRVFRTYTNVLVTNRTVLVPVFRRDRRHEREALRAFERAFPDRRVVPVPADGVMDLAGAVHCTAVGIPPLRGPS